MRRDFFLALATSSFPVAGLELLSNLVDGHVELGGGLVEAEAVLEDDAADDIG